MTRGSLLLGTVVVAALCAAPGCAPIPATPPASALDAHSRMRVTQVEPPAVATAAYRSLLAQSLYSDCRMLPRDSAAFDRDLKRCGATLAVFRGAARLLLERAASPRFLKPVRWRGRLRWIDARGEQCEPEASPNEEAAERSAPAIETGRQREEESLPPPGEVDLLVCGRALGRVRDLAREGAWFDAHTVAEVATTLCASASPRVAFWNAIALYRLDEVARAERLLGTLSTEGAVAAEAAAAAAWINLREGDRESFERRLGTLAPTSRARLRTVAALGDRDRFARMVQRLEPTLQEDAVGAHRAYLEARRKKPWLAGGLSALLPGLGQAYAGSFESAAIAFALNAVLIGATVELSREKLYFAGATTGVAASIFYVGNILNAADLAERGNDRASAAAREELERLLLPELSP